MIRDPDRFEEGIGLIEILVAMASLMIGLLVYGGLTLTVSRGVGTGAERALAIEGARARLELLWSCPFEECFAAFDETTSNDPPDAPGPHFVVPGLSPATDDADGFVGRIRFPTGSPEGGGGEPVLREDVTDPGLGTPLDLDGDGSLDGLPKDTSYVRLPVVVEVRWKGAGGEQSVELSTVLTPWKEGE